jgi:hypothetical protein
MPGREVLIVERFAPSFDRSNLGDGTIRSRLSP